MVENVFHEEYFIKKEHRVKRNKHIPLVIWFTGLSGSGKSTLAKEVEKQLFEKGFSTYVLDADNVRSGLNKDLGFSDAERKENLRRVAEVSKLFLDSGEIVLATFISPKEEERKMVKEIIGDENFMEIFINCPIEVCEKRDVKGNYKKFREGKIKNFVGIDIIFEAPKNPHLEIKSDQLNIQQSVDKILEHILPKLKLN